VALEVHQVFAGDVPDLGDLERLQALLAGLEGGDVVELAPRMDQHLLVPVGPVGLQILVSPVAHVFSGSSHTEPIVFGRAKTAQWWKRGGMNQHLSARKKRISGTMVTLLVFARCTLESSIR
jgi:hypothetical protein